ncbi:MAG: sodium/solute symporter [Caulobacter sp.]|nr:sodium/solute symporter [Caulobacter sp.]
MPPHSLSALDAGLIAIYVTAIIGLGLVLSRRRASAQEFFLASHAAPWPVIGLSLVASNISPTALIGITGSAYAIGISVYNYEWMAAVILALFALVYLPVVLKAGVYTMPEFLERRYDGRARLWFAGLTLLLNMLLDAAGALYGGGLLLRLLAPQLSLFEAVALLAVLAGVYAASGGLRAVMYTEAVQAVIVLLAALTLAWFAIGAAGGWEAVLSRVDPAKLSLIRPAHDPYMPWTGLVFGAPILGFYFWCTNQFMVQRMLAAKSLRDGQKGALFAGLLKLTTLFVIVLPGSAAILLYPRLDHGDEAYPRLLFDLIPSGLLGVILAAFVGALMAQLSATYNSAATLIAMDFIRRARPEMDGGALVRWGRLATLGCMAASILWAPQIARFPSLWEYLQGVLAYVTPPVVALFGVGLLWPRANAQGAFAAIVCGGLTGAALFVGVVSGAWPVQFLHVAVIVFLVSVAALVAGSLATAPRPAAEAVAIPSLGGEPPARSVLLLAGALMAVTALIVVRFR